MKLYSIDTGLFKLDGGAMHGVVPKSMWQKANPADENNMCSWAMRCLLIEDESKLILIDTGMGNKQSEKFFSHYHPHGTGELMASIQQAGYSPDDITDVFLTHLHFDHCGGAVSMVDNQLMPTFKNATYYSNKAHWQTATDPNAREKASFLKENILPLQEQGVLQFIEKGNPTSWTEHIDVYFVDGHTDAMMLPLIDYHGQKILYCADLIPSMAHISLPWVMAYDMRPLDTLIEKERLLKLAADEQWLLFFEHDLHNELCSLQHTDRGVRVKEVMRVGEV